MVSSSGPSRPVNRSSASPKMIVPAAAPLAARQAEAGPLGTVLILGITGISGYLAAQNARPLGATRVIGAGRNPAGLERAAASGAQTATLTGDPWRRRRRPPSLLRSRKLTISGSGAGSVTAASIATQIPAYIKLIADGSVQVPFRTFPLSEAGTAWTASTDSGPRVVLVPD
jgi:hypothetical protein